MPYRVGCRVLPGCEAIASHPLFQAILDRMGLPAGSGSEGG
jgi:hypothetical protein